MKENHYSLSIEQIEVIHIELWLVSTFDKGLHWNQTDGIGLMVMVAPFQNYILLLGAESVV